ncbi:MAG: molybdate ABC transporter substrate-binding protein [Paracoccaceae bacterium]|nr:molybdate ABC transporter substrate-binding protein [Paracoccaceae bacterium]
MLRRLVLLLALAVAAPAGAAERLVVFAAASLKGALDHVAAAWADAGGAEVALSYAGSSALARQIEAGAPADVILSASAEWMDYLEERGLLREGTRRALLGNRLVLVRYGASAAAVEIGPGFDLAGLLGGGRLAMALVEAVPAGIYGREALAALGLWDAVQGSVAQAADVRGALALVASGEAPLGIVYATDAAAEPDVSVVGVFPEASHAPIVYPVAVTAASLHAEAEAFLAFLGTVPARAAFESAGFAVLEGR